MTWQWDRVAFIDNGSSQAYASGWMLKQQHTDIAASFVAKDSVTYTVLNYCIVMTVSISKNAITI